MNIQASFVVPNVNTPGKINDIIVVRKSVKNGTFTDFYELIFIIGPAYAWKKVKNRKKILRYRSFMEGETCPQTITHLS